MGKIILGAILFISFVTMIVNRIENMDGRLHDLTRRMNTLESDKVSREQVDEAIKRAKL